MALNAHSYGESEAGCVLSAVNVLMVETPLLHLCVHMEGRELHSWPLESFQGMLDPYRQRAYIPLALHLHSTLELGEGLLQTDGFGVSSSREVPGWGNGLG